MPAKKRFSTEYSCDRYIASRDNINRDFSYFNSTSLVRGNVQFNAIGGEVAWYCPSLDSSSFGTSTIKNLVNGADKTLTAEMNWKYDGTYGGNSVLESTTDNQYVYIGHTIPAGQACSITGWVFLLSGDTFICGNNTNNFIQRRFDGVRARFMDSYISFLGMGNIPINKWSHFTLTRDTDGTSEFFIDGESIGVVSGTTKQFQCLKIGAVLSTTAYSFTGKIDDFRIFYRILSVNEVRKLANNRPA
jgi:hypothetical protein